MENKNRTFVLVVSLICITACISDYIIDFVLGSMYPGYSQLSNTLSELGVSASPVSSLISAWWGILGGLFVIFAIGVRKAYPDGGKIIRWASWLIIIYGLGDGVSSGVFKISRFADGQLTNIGLVHDGLGGIGVAAIMILPFVLLKFFPKETNRGFHRFSWVILVAGPVMLILFSIAKMLDNPDNFFVMYKGLWQRLMSLVFYSYLIVLAIRMIRHVYLVRSDKVFLSS
jgi:hypothetical protein